MTLGWATRDEVVLNQMQTGYPRFFIHRLIERLAQHVCEKLKHEFLRPQKAMLFPSKTQALRCKRYLTDHAPETSPAGICVVSLASSPLIAAEETTSIHWEHAEIHAVLYPSDLYSLAKPFWQHTGFGISSRYAKFCLDRVDDLQLQTSHTPSMQDHTHSTVPENKPPATCGEKKGFHASLQETADVGIKSILRRRIARLVSSEKNAVAENDVYLFPCGMSAISTIAQALLANAGSEGSLNVVAYG